MGGPPGGRGGTTGGVGACARSNSGGNGHEEPTRWVETRGGTHSPN